MSSAYETSAVAAIDPRADADAILDRAASPAAAPPVNMTVMAAEVHPESTIRVSAADETVIPCVLYAAKSTEDKRGSIPDQLHDCRVAIEQDPGRRIVEEYFDESFSAFHRSRGPDLVAAMNHAEALAAESGPAELWAQHSDRLARGDGKTARHAVEIALWALKLGVAVRTVQDPETFRDLLYAVVTGQRNHEDSRRKGLAVAAGRRRAAVRGDYLGYKPDGYRMGVSVDESGAVRKRLVLDVERQPVIEMIFRMALRGASMGAIARALNRKGWMTKPLFRRVGPKPWTSERVRVVVRNPRYASLSVVKGEVVASGQWPAYVTLREHERLQARWAARSSAGWTQRKPETYLLARIATCGWCGGPVIARTQQRRNDGAPDRRYGCARHKLIGDPDRCQAPVMSADMIEAMFVAALWPLLLSGESEVHPGATTVVRPTVTAVDRQRVIDAVLTSDKRQIDDALRDVIGRRATEATLQQRIAMSRRPGPELDAVRRCEAWAEQELVGRTQETRDEVAALNKLLRDWFSTIVITLNDTTVTIAATRQAATERPAHTAEVRYDLQGWTRLAPQARGLRRLNSRWNGAEILGALQAWADIHGVSPTEADWATSDLDHPGAVTVLRYFRTWNDALRRAGLTTPAWAAS